MDAMSSSSFSHGDSAAREGVKGSAGIHAKSPVLKKIKEAQEGGDPHLLVAHAEVGAGRAVEDADGAELVHLAAVPHFDGRTLRSEPSTPFSHQMWGAPQSY
jgi:hypothetical protein